MQIAQRYRGCLLGLAVGDAGGAALEFKQPRRFRPITDMIGRGPFRLAPGQWTDDTSMALWLARRRLATGTAVIDLIRKLRCNDPRCTYRFTGNRPATPVHVRMERGGLGCTPSALLRCSVSRGPSRSRGDVAPVLMKRSCCHDMSS